MLSAPPSMGVNHNDELSSSCSASSSIAAALLAVFRLFAGLSRRGASFSSGLKTKATYIWFTDIRTQGAERGESSELFFIYLVIFLGESALWIFSRHFFPFCLFIAIRKWLHLNGLWSSMSSGARLGRNTVTIQYQYCMNTVFSKNPG